MLYLSKSIVLNIQSRHYKFIQSIMDQKLLNKSDILDQTINHLDA